MKILTKTIIVVGAATAVGAMAFAGVSQAERGWGGKHGGFGGPVRMLEQFDTDGDGRLTQVEIDTARTDRFAKYDADGDGALSLEEFSGLFLEVSRPMMVRAYQKLDPNGDASVTVEEFDRPFANLVERHDRDGDGALSRADMKRGHHRSWKEDREDRDDDS